MFLLAVVDILIASCVIMPLVVSFWRGTWEYLVYYSHDFPISWTLYISTVLHISFTLLREPLYEQRKPGLLGLVIARIYIYIFAIVNIAQWRALFTLIDVLLSPEQIHITGLASALILACTNTLGSLVGPPFVIFLDHRQKDIFIYPTLLSVDSRKKMALYLFDCCFSVCVIGTLVVFVWRGLWSLLDQLLYPDDRSLSALVSLGAGYLLVLLTFLLQPLMKHLAKTLSGFWRLAVVDLYLLFSFSGTVNVWRGIWTLLNVYFLPDNPGLSYGLTHGVPFLLLVLINSSNSILVRGVYIDGEESGSQCVDFPCYYLRLFFQAKRKKRLLRESLRSRGGDVTKAANGPEANQLLSP